jgi:FdhD protein
VYALEGKKNIVEAELQDHVQVNLARLERHFYMSSSCGVCGKASLDAISMQAEVLLEDEMQITAEQILSFSSLLREQQRVFASTGGLHAAALFSTDGVLLSIAEDIGRHNAVDKIIGHLFYEQIDMRKTILVLSGRAGFEIIQKAMVAQIPAVVAVGAPSSLALQLSKRFGATLIGFLKPDRFNLYSGAHRVSL